MPRFDIICIGIRTGDTNAKPASASVPREIGVSDTDNGLHDQDDGGLQSEFDYGRQDWAFQHRVQSAGIGTARASGIR